MSGNFDEQLWIRKIEEKAIFLIDSSQRSSIKKSHVEISKWNNKMENKLSSVNREIVWNFDEQLREFEKSRRKQFVTFLIDNSQRSSIKKSHVEIFKWNNKMENNLSSVNREIVWNFDEQLREFEKSRKK